jgi:hypothetical protein
MNFDERFVTVAPPAGAFLYLADLKNCPSWDPNITAVEQLTPGVVGLGARFRVTMHMLGLSSTLEYHVEAYEPDRRIIFIGRSFAARVTDTILVTPFRGGSRIRWTADIRLFAPLVLLDPVFNVLMRPAMTKAMASLKQSLNRLAPAMKIEPVPLRPMPPDVDAYQGVHAHHG